MKQFIGVEEINTQLSDKGRRRLLEWAISKQYLTLRYTTFSIGQMIEFLGIHIIYLENEAGWWGIKTIGILEDIEPVPELCDALWEAVKQVLEQP